MFQFLAQSAIEDLAIPNTHVQAMNCAEAKFWKEAERKELEALKEKSTFGICKTTPAGRKPVRSRWVYAKKFDENNNLIKFKARLVAKGYTQVYGEDYLELVWIKLFMSELGYAQGSVTILEDNQAAIRIAKNPQDHKRTKHIQGRYHYVRDQVCDGVVTLKYIPTIDQLADIFTKALNGPRLRDLRSRLGITKVPASEGELNMSLLSM